MKIYPLSTPEGSPSASFLITDSASPIGLDARAACPTGQLKAITLSARPAPSAPKRSKVLEVKPSLGRPHVPATKKVRLAAPASEYTYTVEKQADHQVLHAYRVSSAQAESNLIAAQDKAKTLEDTVKDWKGNGLIWKDGSAVVNGLYEKRVFQDMRKDNASLLEAVNAAYRDDLYSRQSSEAEGKKSITLSHLLFLFKKNDSNPVFFNKLADVYRSNLILLKPVFLKAWQKAEASEEVRIAVQLVIAHHYGSSKLRNELVHSQVSSADIRAVLEASIKGNEKETLRQAAMEWADRHQVAADAGED